MRLENWGNASRRERVLSMEELRAISDGAEQMGYPFGPLFRLLIFTGQRRSEIALARRRWLLQDLRTLEIPAASYKTGRPHAVPLAEPSLRILASLPRGVLATTSSRQRPG